MWIYSKLVPTKDIISGNQKCKGANYNSLSSNNRQNVLPLHDAALANIMLAVRVASSSLYWCKSIYCNTQQEDKTQIPPNFKFLLLLICRLPS